MRTVRNLRWWILLPLLSLLAVTACGGEEPTSTILPSPTPTSLPTPSSTPTHLPTAIPTATPVPMAMSALWPSPEFLPVGASLEPLPFQEIEGYRVLRTPDNSSVAKVLNEKDEHIAYLGSYLPMMFSEKGILSSEIEDGLIFYGQDVVYIPWFPKKEGLIPYPALNEENRLVVVYVDEKGKVDSVEEKYVQVLGEGQTAKMNFEEGFAEVNGVILPIWGEPAPEPTPVVEKGYREEWQAEVLGFPVKVTLITDPTLQNRTERPISKITLNIQTFPDAARRLTEAVMRGHWHAWKADNPGERGGVSFEEYMDRLKKGEDVSYQIAASAPEITGTVAPKPVMIDPIKPVEIVFSDKAMIRDSVCTGFTFYRKPDGGLRPAPWACADMEFSSYQYSGGIYMTLRFLSLDDKYLMGQEPITSSVYLANEEEFDDVHDLLLDDRRDSPTFYQGIITFPERDW